MGLLDKKNPSATRRSVVCWAAGGGLLAFAGTLYVALFGHTDIPSGAWWFFVPWMTIWGAVAGGAIEWQMG
jgi:hypothetical protein